jgi:hypothetical protein
MILSLPPLVIISLLVVGLGVGLWFWQYRGRRGEIAPIPTISPARRATGIVIAAPSAPVAIGAMTAPPVNIAPTASEPLVIGPTPTPPLVVAPAATEPLVIAPAPGRRPLVVAARTPDPAVVAPPPRAAWDERGWTMRQQDGARVYEGEYRIRDRRAGREQRFAGRMREARNGVTVYIADPPPEIRSHPKSSCFHLLAPPATGQPTWFVLHWHRPAKDPDSALLYLEKVLDEAINRRG